MNFSNFINKNDLSLFENNPAIHNKNTYIIQPSLNLYNPTLYTQIENKQYINNINNKFQQIHNSLNELILQTNKIIQKQNKPTFIQQIFSIKNEGKHKAVRFLGLKLKFRRQA
ncbi:hypothetical protein J6G99_07650 [bacterium]|nr:hypothetical protein [bacterium]